MLCCCHLEIFNNFIVEPVFCKCCLMGQGSMSVNRGDMCNKHFHHSLCITHLPCIDWMWLSAHIWWGHQHQHVRDCVSRGTDSPERPRFLYECRERTVTVSKAPRTRELYHSLSCSGYCPTLANHRCWKWWHWRTGKLGQPTAPFPFNPYSSLNRG